MLIMNITLIVSVLAIWVLGWINAVQMLSSDEETSNLSRAAILIGCAFWPVALAIAIVRIVVFAVIGKKETQE